MVFPQLSDLQKHAGNALSQSQIRNDIAYSLMLTRLPTGWIGLVLTGLIAAYMSTLSTQLNWGASYLVNDVWKRFIRPEAKQKELVWMGRAFTGLRHADGRDVVTSKSAILHYDLSHFPDFLLAPYFLFCQLLILVQKQDRMPPPSPVSLAE